MTKEGTFSSVAHIDVPGPVGRDNPSCQLRDVLDRVGDKWSVLVMALLGGGPRRYSELRRAVEGISQRMLTLTLRGLERDGLVIRSVTPSTPPQVRYALSPAGQTLASQVSMLIDWAQAHRDYIAAARHRYDTKRTTA